MRIDQLAGATANPTATTAASANAKVDYDAFLKLLVAEMSNQDPTQPMDSTEYISQLATFSQVEQTVQTNSKLDAMLTSNGLLLAESLIGNKVTSGDGTQSGVIKSVQLTDNGVAVTLEDGTDFTLGPGVKIE